MIYEPAEDSHLLARIVRHSVRGKSFLDVGTGSGIQSEAALAGKARSVLALDINPQAVAHVKKKGIPAKVSDLFSSVTGTFDVIAFNPPYLPADEREDAESQRVTTGGDQGDELICRFLSSLKNHLKPQGICFLLLSSLTPRTRIQSLLKKKELSYVQVAKEKMFMESLEVWKITRQAQ